MLSVPYALHANTATSTTGNTGGFTHYIGELFGGGIVVSVWKDAQGVERGLIASLTNLSAGIPWTTPDFQQAEIGSAAQSPINGLANTNAIVAQAGAGITYAAGLCKAYNAGGFTDWYLPATWELNQCYNAAMIVNELLGNTNGFQFSNSSISNYWSSTEYDGFNAWYHGFLFGSSENYNFGSGKLTNEAVRAVRRF